jgi:membrane-bound lytic murein transglycosylase D
MTIQRLTGAIFAILLTLTIGSTELRAQANSYQQMSQTDRAQFVANQARRIAAEMSGRDYEFTPAFLEDIQQSVNQYTRRIGSENGNLDKQDLRLVLERGQANAAALSAAFKARNVSPLIGLYVPWIESEYINISSPNSMGAIGMFQFLPKTGERFGLSAADLLDVTKSADAAARYISGNLDKFKDDPMPEALALLAYNRGEQQTARDVKFLVNAQNRQCSICALTADRSKLDERFRYENVFYVPRFFAAAIIGENPAAFGLKGEPLSSH